MHIHGPEFSTTYTTAASHTGTAIVYHLLLGVPVTQYTSSANVQMAGHEVLCVWKGVWIGTEDMSGQEVVDLSDLNYTNRVYILSVHGACTEGIAWTLRFYDATTDDVICKRTLGSPQAFYHDFTRLGRIGAYPTNAVSSGRDGDVVLDTASGASGDEITLVLRLWCE